MKKFDRLNIGCGTTPTEGWLNFDNSFSITLARLPVVASLLRTLKLLSPLQIENIAFNRRHEIRFCDATRRLPVADASADVVYSSHMVEHLDRDEAGQFLREAMRVLTPGGTLRIAVPNLQWHVGNYLASANADDFMAQTRLGRTLPKTFAAKLRAMVFGVRGDHVWMYDERSLARLLEQAGFARVKACPPGQTRIAEPGALNLTERFPESIFVEGTKP